MIALGKLSAYARAGKDESGLGRAVPWILFDYYGHKFCIVTAYRPCTNKKRQTKSGRLSKSVWRQLFRYYKEVMKIPDPKPIALFDNYLFGKIKS